MCLLYIPHPSHQLSFVHRNCMFGEEYKSCSSWLCNLVLPSLSPNILLITLSVSVQKWPDYLLVVGMGVKRWPVKRGSTAHALLSQVVHFK
jgi:hypothetical protein